MRQNHKKAKELKTEDEKIAYIFDEVKINIKMEWSLSVLYRRCLGLRAWDKKLGNSTEINFMVYHLLKKAV